MSAHQGLSVGIGRAVGYQGPTFVFKKVAHACATSEDQLRDILDDLGFILGRKRDEPFGKALVGMVSEWTEGGTNTGGWLTTLPCLESRIK